MSDKQIKSEKNAEFESGNLAQSTVTDDRGKTAADNSGKIAADDKGGVAALSEKYRRLYFEDKERTLRDAAAADRYMENSTAVFSRGKLSFQAVPKLFDEQAYAVLKNAASVTYGILKKVIKRYQSDANYRKLFPFSTELEELILHDPWYKQVLPFARVDLFLNESDLSFKFCEINTDGASAMNEDREIFNALKNTETFKEFKKSYNVKSFELFESLADKSLDIFDEFKESFQKNFYGKKNKGSGKSTADINAKFFDAVSGKPTNTANAARAKSGWETVKENHDYKPNVAIVDFLESATLSEFKVFQKAFEAKGCKAEIAEVRSLKLKNGLLTTASGMAVDFVYRRAVTSECMEKRSEIDEFITAYKQNAVCVAGAFRTQVVHNKLIFKILRDPQTKAFLSDAENDFVERHVPKTYLLSSSEIKLDLCDEAESLPENETTKTANCEAEKVSQNCDAPTLNEVLENKDVWLIKPTDRYGSFGVVAGADCTKKEWERAVLSAMNEGYVLQEFCTPYSAPSVYFADSTARASNFNNMTGMFMYGGKLKGLYSRQFPTRVTGRENEGRVACTLVCKPKKQAKGN